MVQNRSSILISAPRNAVWQAITLPGLVKQWQYGSDLATSWAPGSPVRFTTQWNDQVFEQWGTVLEVVENELLRYSLFAPRPGLEDKPENYFTMIYRLHDEAGGTRLEIIQEDGRPGAKQEAPQGAENPVLHQLKAVAEGL